MRIKHIVPPIIGGIILFMSPWIHRLAYENTRAALPSMGEDAAHGIVLMLQLTSLVCIFVYYENRKWDF